MPYNQNKDRLKVLIVEDDEMFRKLSGEMLREYTVFYAKNASEALQKFQLNNPDITFLDIGLPDRSGHEVLKEIRKIKPDAFVIMLTASNLKQDVKDSISSGSSGYIIKPFSRKQISNAVEKFNLLKGNMA